MRRAPPQSKEKNGSPRVTLRLHEIKARDEKRGTKIAADVASYSNSRAQFSTSMEGKSESNDIGDLTTKDEASVHAASSSQDIEKEVEGSGTPIETLTTPLQIDTPMDRSGKRNSSELNEDVEEGDEVDRRKKRKDLEGGKETARNGGSASLRFFSGRNGNSSNKGVKNTSDTRNGNNSGGKGSHGNGSGDRKSPNNTSGTTGKSPKVSGGSGKTPASLGTETDADSEEVRSSKGGSNSSLDSGSTGRPKVPPLKIVIPQQNSSMEQEQGNRNGKNGAARHHQALPYVVASSNSNDSNADKESGGPPGQSSTSINGPSVPECAGNSNLGKGEEKKDATSGGASTEDQHSNHHQRILRSSHRSGSGTSGGSTSSGGPSTSVSSSNPLPSSSAVTGSSATSPSATTSSGHPPADRSSNNSSPQQTGPQHQSPTPAEMVTPVTVAESTATCPTKPVTAASTTVPSVEEKTVEPMEQPKQQQQTFPAQQVTSVELHPRKRKMKQSKESQMASTSAAVASTSTTEATEAKGTTTDVPPAEQPIPNGYQSFLNIRKQVERRRKGLFPVQPKPPQGFKDYLMNRCTYVLAGNASSHLAVPMLTPPASMQSPMKDFFSEQEKDRHKLRMQHVVEKEKLVLSVEQEILRVHGRAARALANQSLPYSVCTILRDEEIYNPITPEQEEKDRNARSRYNGRLFLSWLQDVDDKWEKIKEAMLIRHHIEAESLHAVQCMDWEWKMKELGICEFKMKPVIDDTQVPMVHVSDDFDLLPA